jgi:parallel beta-helix repeat protein
MVWNGAAEFKLPASYFPTSSTGSTITVGSGSPYATIQQGIAAAEKAGASRVLVAAGTYNENDVIGAADKGLTISAASGGVTLVGSISINNTSSITISGLTLQGNGSNVAITAIGSQGVTITDNSFTGTGEGVVLDGTTGSSVSDNLITNTAGSAIEAKNGANNDTFDSNVITGVGAVDTIGAIDLHGANNDSITHNAISNTTGAAISLRDFSPPGTTTTQNNNDVIAYNSLTGVDTTSQDSGAVYILGRSQNQHTGDQVTMNFISGVGSVGVWHSVGIYLDDNTSGVSVTSNVLQASSTLVYAFQIHGGSNDVVSGNIFDLGTGSTGFGLLQEDQGDQVPVGTIAQLTNDAVSGNIFATESTAPHNPAFDNLTGGRGNLSISGNDYWAFSKATLNVSGSGANGDVAAKYVAPASAAAASETSYAGWSGAGIGFKAIDTSLIGPAPSGAHPY